MYETWGYRADAKGSEEIGDFPTFTAKLQAGYSAYRAALEEATGLPVVTAALAAAFALVREKDPAVWEGLYQPDHFHPSCTGTYLAAAHIAALIAGACDRVTASLPKEWPAACPVHGSLHAWPGSSECTTPPPGAELLRVVEMAGPASS